MKLQKKAKKGNTVFFLKNVQHDKKIGQLILWNIVTQRNNTLAYQCFNVSESDGSDQYYITLSCCKAEMCWE